VKFGVQASQSGITWSEYLDLVQWLDRDSRFDYLWLTDHFVTGFGTAFGSEGPYFEGWTTLAAVAQATSRLRIGVLVSGNTYRHPAVLAKQATTVDHISGGRLEFGLGGAWHVYEHEVFGIPFLTTKERLDRLDEAAELIKKLWTEDRPTFEGKYYQLKAPPYNPANLQKPHPPILIGGAGEKRTLRTVARFADVANISFNQAHPDTVRHKFEVLDGHCRDIGRDPTGIRRTVQVLCMMGADEAAVQRMVQGMSAMLGLTLEQARDTILAGTPDEVRAHIERLAAAGVQETYITLFGQTAGSKPMLEAFSSEIIPALVA
jgi:F420-dependent oxidoreductase-like protein